MGAVAKVQCPRCGLEPLSRSAFKCGSCSTILDITVQIDHLTRADFAAMRQSRDHTIWRWRDFLPVEDRSCVVSLGEGSSPLIQAPRLGAHLGLPRLHLKNDTVLPTGSLKDRSNSVGISKARELGFTTTAVMSTGNAAASVAAYSAAAGMSSVVMVPAGTALAKIAQARAYGASVIVVEGEFDKELAALYKAAIEEFGWYDCLSSNPYRAEGKKTYAYEITDQLDNETPGWLIHPTAGGTGIYAAWKGFKELLSLGWIERAPKLVAAQSEAAAPIVHALLNGLSNIEPVKTRPTIAESIQVGNPASLGWRALAALRESAGTAVALSDGEIIEAQRLTAAMAGIFVEPAAAASVAAARKLRTQGAISPDEIVVCNLTGHGLKQPEAIGDAPDLQPISPTLEALSARLRRGDR